MNFGLNERDWKIVQERAIRPLKDRQAKVWIFGSRARGDQKEFSDLDLLYEIRTPLPLSEIGKIQEDLEESRLPIRVDLVDLRDLAEGYRPSVMRDRKAV